MSTTERRLKITPGTNIRWDHSYGIGREYHWCLVSDESEADGKCINPYTVLFTSCDMDMGGQPIDECPDLALYADAHNTANACDMLPSELEADRKELLSLVQVLVDALGHRLDGTREDCSDNMASFKEPQLGINHGWQALSLASSKYGITPTPK